VVADDRVGDGAEVALDELGRPQRRVDLRQELVEVGRPAGGQHGPVLVDDGGEGADLGADRGPGGGAHDVLPFEVVAGSARQRWVAA
jgi:hypothetical protein